MREKVNKKEVRREHPRSEKIKIGQRRREKKEQKRK